MNFYSVYGSCLGTSMVFPELRPVTGMSPKWTFETTPALPPMQNAAELGAEHIYGDVHARLFSHSNGHRITVDDTGAYDISPDGARTVWQERSESWPDFVRGHLIGRILATSLYFEGMLPLHGSAVEFDQGTIAFLAPKRFGKSSLALTLTTQGARLVTDDTLPIELLDAPRAWPGVHTMRLHGDVIAAMGLAEPATESSDGKAVVSDIPAERVSTAPAPLRAIYLLDPTPPEAVPEGAARTPLAGKIAALAVASHVKIGRMLGGSAAPILLDRAARIARDVPVYRLQMASDLARLPAAAATIASWHR